MKPFFLEPLRLLPLLVLAACTPPLADSPADRAATTGRCDVVMHYDIDFERFDETAQQIAHATGCGIQTDLSLTGAVRPRPVQGRYTPREAVTRAIEGTTLRITRNEPDLIVVE